MTTNITIIEDALRDINVISEVQSASAEQGAHALRKLNQVMEAWKENDIDFGWFSQTLTTDTIPVPDWAEIGVTSALSIAIASKYGASVSQELIAVGEAGMSMILRKMISEKLKNADMSHLPTGSNQSSHNILNDR